MANLIISVEAKNHIVTTVTNARVSTADEMKAVQAHNDRVLSMVVDGLKVWSRERMPVDNAGFWSIRTVLYRG